jgi:hypothetical protein
MKHHRPIARFITFALTLCAIISLSGALATAQEKQETQEKATPAGKTTGAGRDPFVRYKPPVKPKSTKTQATQITPPSIQERITQYKAQKQDAMRSQKPAPKPTTALLLSEMQITGIFRTPRGYAAMVEATPIKLSYVIYPGEVFYDGQLVAIEENRLVFRRYTRWSNGKTDTVVETKPLRQPNAVADAMTTPTRASSNTEADNASGPARPPRPTSGSDKP